MTALQRLCLTGNMLSFGKVRLPGWQISLQIILITVFIRFLKFWTLMVGAYSTGALIKFSTFSQRGKIISQQNNKYEQIASCTKAEFKHDIAVKLFGLNSSILNLIDHQTMNLEIINQKRNDNQYSSWYSCGCTLLFSFGGNGRGGRWALINFSTNRLGTYSGLGDYPTNTVANPPLKK